MPTLQVVQCVLFVYLFPYSWSVVFVERLVARLTRRMIECWVQRIAVKPTDVKYQLWNEVSFSRLARVK